jgi:HK97 gp10 family phage protein
MPEIAIKITNLPQIKAAFARAPYLMTKELNIAIGQTVLSIGGESRRRTPVDTGRLRASTYERFANLRGEVGTDTVYDRFVHYGTRYMQARPYLANAVKANQTNTERYFTKAVDRVLNVIGKAT